MGGIDHLRSLAKVRLVDNIQNKNEQNYPKIISGTFIGVQNALCVTPAAASAYVNGSQVHDTHVADPDNDGESGTRFFYPLGVMPASWTNLASNEYRGEIRGGYVPEMSIFNVNGDVRQGLPIFRIDVAVGLDAAGNETVKSFDVPMTGYLGETFSFGSSIFRNHIYTLSVTYVKSDGLLLNVGVRDWRSVSFEYEY